MAEMRMPAAREVTARNSGRDEAGRIVPSWIPPLLVVMAIALTPWIGWLLLTLPSRATADHWQIAWGGFDVAVAVLLAATGISLIRRSTLAGVFAPMTAAILLCDAWFDVVTAHGTTTFALAVGEAVFVEVPLALICLWITRNIERVLADARPWLERAGFRIERRRLVPPAGD
jgi:hypothetical protein